MGQLLVEVGGHMRQPEVTKLRWAIFFKWLDTSNLSADVHGFSGRFVEFPEFFP